MKENSLKNNNKVIIALMLIVVSIILIVISCIAIIYSKGKVSMSDSKYGEILQREDIYMEVVAGSQGKSSLKVNIYNNTDKVVYYGAEYSIEKLDEDKSIWKAYDVEASFIDIACELDKNSVNLEEINFGEIYGELQKGTYRVIKNVNGEVLSCTFYID